MAVFGTAYLLIATEKINQVAVALGGASIMLAIGATDAEHAFFSSESGVDWRVIFLLLGMMLIVGVLKRTGLFEYLAICRGRPSATAAAARGRWSHRDRPVAATQPIILAEHAASSIAEVVPCQNSSHML